MEQYHSFVHENLVSSHQSETSVGPGEKQEKKSQQANGQWIIPGGKVTIRGFSISNGMIYIKNNVQNRSEDHNPQVDEPGCIDPDLEIDLFNPDRLGNTLPYKPAYGDLTPGARAAYLEFLSEGASDQHVNIGYVFIYYYGLERRVLEDLQKSDNNNERKLLAREMRRLLSIYHHDISFKGYASNLLTFLDAHDVTKVSPKDVLKETLDLGNANQVLIAMGQNVNAGNPLPVELVLAWLKTATNIQFGPPAIRFPNEFFTLFKERFNQSYPEGLIIQPDHSMLTLIYYPANSALPQKYERETNLPGLGSIERPLERLKEIVGWATDGLAPYCNWMERHQDQGNMLPGIALLPFEILREKDNQEPFKSFLKFLNKRLAGKNKVVIPTADLMVHWPCEDKDTISKSEAVSLAQFLGRLMVGLEPDVRFDSTEIKYAGTVVLFRMSERGSQTVSARYTEVSTFSCMAALIAWADAVMDDREQWCMEEYLQSQTDLATFERERLDAYLGWLVVSPPDVEGIKKRLKVLNIDKSQALGQFLVRIVLADGYVHPKEVTLLEKIYQYIQLDPNQVHANLHALQASPYGDALLTAVREDGMGVVTFQEQEQVVSENRPVLAFGNGAGQNSGVQLDRDRIRQLQVQTAHVRDLLLAVFSEEEKVPPNIPKADDYPEDLQRVDGLDVPHLILFHKLLNTTLIDRKLFDNLCKSLDLLPEGSVEVINDTAYRLVGEPVYSEDDPIEINTSVAMKMLILH